MDADYQRVREEKYRSDSKQRLSKILRKEDRDYYDWGP